MTSYNSTFGERRKFLHHPIVDRALEGDDQFREILHRFPAPADELGLVAARRVLDIDLAVLAREAHGEPFLPLAAIASLPGAARYRARDVVGQPVRDFAQLLDRADAGLLIELALGGFPGILAGIDAALRHLPDMGLVDMLDAARAATDEDQPLLVDQHHADAGSIGQIFIARHAASHLSAPFSPLCAAGGAMPRPSLILIS